MIHNHTGPCQRQASSLNGGATEFRSGEEKATTVSRRETIKKISEARVRILSCAAKIIGSDSFKNSVVQHTDW